MTTSTAVESLPPLEFGAKPHRGTPAYPGGQQAWIRACIDYEVVSVLVGRDSGKTVGVWFLFWEEGREARGHYDFAYVAQGHPQAEKFYEWFLKQVEPAGLVVAKRNKGQDRWIELRQFGTNTGATIHFWSGEADALDNLRGVRLNRLAVDEAGFVSRKVLPTCSPMLLSRRGKKLFIGTARRGGCGFVWFKDAYDRGVAKVPQYASFNAPSESNPFNDPAKVLFERRAFRDARAPDTKTPEEREEFDGEFVSDLGACFRNLDSAFVVPILRTEQDGLVVASDPDPADRYVIGQDWGLKHDHSVSSVFSLKYQRQVAVRREALGVPYKEQVNRLATLRLRYNGALVVADNRDAGSEANVRLMTEHGAHVKRIAFTGQGPDGKGFHVARVKHLFDAGAWQLIDLPDQLEEFTIFTQTPIGEHGNGFYYEAPPGKHDDYVTAAIYAASLLHVAPPAPPPARKFPEPCTKEWFEWKARERRRAVRRRGF